ncbi:MAG: dTDP-glucose 4,6-dehydratase [bacterium]
MSGEKRYVITGGAGFIGSNLVRMLLKEPEVSVYIIDALTYAGSMENLADVAEDPRFEFADLDIRTGNLYNEIAWFKPTVVFHLAAETHVDRSIDGVMPFVSTNVAGTARMLNAVKDYWSSGSGCSGSCRFIHVSTDEVYGSLGMDDAKFTENSPYAPNSPYAATKAASDHLVRAYNKTYGMPTIITHCSNNYGPYQFPEKLIPLTILNAIEGKPIPVYGNGMNVRDWIHVDDHCEALIRVATDGTPGEVYNIGSSQERNTLQVVHSICDALSWLRENQNGYRRLIGFVTDRPGHDFRYAIEASKLWRHTGWLPKRDFEKDIRHTVRWYLEHLDWCEKAKAKYNRERLGLGVGPK